MRSSLLPATVVSAPACADSRYWRGGAIRDDARTFGEGLRRSTVAHFARKVRGTNIAAAKHGLKIQQSNAPERWTYSLRVRAPHFASKVSYNAGAATEGDEYCGGQARAENPTKQCPRALVMFATCSWPSLCEQSELQCWRRNRRLCDPALISAARELPPTFNISILNTPHL